MNNDIRFKNRKLEELFNLVKANVADEINSYSSKKRLNGKVSDITTMLLSKHQIVAPVIDEEKVYQLTPVEVKMPFNNYWKSKFRFALAENASFTFVIPFKGDSDLFQMSMNDNSINNTKALVTKGRLLMSYTVKADNEIDETLNVFENNLKSTKALLNEISKEVELFNNQLKKHIELSVTNALEQAAKKAPVEQVA